MLKIGPYTLSSVETGSFALDGGAMFGIIPKPLWEKTNPADTANRIDMRLRCLLIRKPADATGPARNILVDCGIGLKWAEKFEKMYKIDHTQWSLVTELAGQGLRLEDITDVIATHLHFDHAGGLTRRERPTDPQSPLVPTFPNAKIWVQERNWELAWHPSEKDQASYLTENYGLYQSDLKSKLTLVSTRAVEPTGRELYSGPRTEETELLPGISVSISNGHTLGMQIVRIQDPTRREATNLIYCADLIPTATHVRTAWIMGYDCYPIFILQEKKLLLNRAADEGSILFYEHCPRFAATRVVRTAKGDFEAGEGVTV